MNMSTNIPHVEAYRINGSAYVMCPYCYCVHIHGCEPGHRTSHCRSGRVDRGYTFEPVKPTPEIEKAVTDRCDRGQLDGYAGTLAVVANMITPDMLDSNSVPTSSGLIACVHALKAARKAGATVSLRERWLPFIMRETLAGR